MYICRTERLPYIPEDLKQFAAGLSNSRDGGMGSLCEWTPDAPAATRQRLSSTARARRDKHLDSLDPDVQRCDIVPCNLLKLIESFRDPP
jgi:hypothetical protein